MSHQYDHWLSLKHLMLLSGCFQKVRISGKKASLTEISSYLFDYFKLINFFEITRQQTRFWLKDTAVIFVRLI